MIAAFYVEQSAVPRGEIKRPDLLVGIPPISMLAFDVNAKRITLVHAPEHKALLQFEQLFSIATSS